MASGTGSHPNRISPRKFSEKIALLNKKEREANKKFEEIIKEVQATTKQQPQHQQQVCTQESTDSSSGLSILQDELRLIGSGENYQAVHADSLEEIEKVYENLMKSVGQYDDEGQENNLYQRAGQYNGDTAVKSTFYHQASPDSVGQPPNNAPINTTAASTTFIPSLSSTTTFYPQQPNDNDPTIGAPRTDLINNGNLQQRGSIRDPIVIPCESSKNDFSGQHHQLDICVSASCEPPRQQQQQHSNYNRGPNMQTIPSSCRARVVSFGSATRQKYPCATSDLLNQQENCHSNRQQTSRTDHLNYHTQYLKEPSGDRSRQKSCSDPQLHISPNQHMIVNPMAQCSSENRLANHHNQNNITFDSNELPQSTMDCCDTNHHQVRSQQHPSEAAYKLAYADPNLMPEYVGGGGGAGDQLVQKTNDANNSGGRRTQTNLIGELGFCQGQPIESHQEHFYGMCDTTSSRGQQLPGIKICTIEDDPTGRMMSNVLERSSRNSNHSNNSTPPSRDGSLPDISNLKFGNNSTNASPERRVVVQKQQQPPPPTHWPRENMSSSPISGTNTDLTNTSAALDEFCQLPDVGWSSSYGDSGANQVEMDVQVDSSSQVIQQQYIQSQPSSDQMNNRVQDDHGRGRWQPSNRGISVVAQQEQQQLPHQPFAHPLPPKVNNTLSNSDCGFHTSPFHQQQGSLMICTSSDFYNNIIRSRSHNNISSINHPKRGQHYPCNALQQIEQHHTSQYCLPTDQCQPIMSVRRIDELKACGSSTSPLDSSSNLNSPQSEMNSPGSSTTEQCEATAVLFPNNNNNATQQERQFSVKPLTNGSSSSTLVPDELQFMPPYASTTSPDNPQGQQQQLPETIEFGRDVCNQSHQ